MTTITATLNAFITSAHRLQTFRDSMKKGDQTEAVDSMTFCAGDLSHLSGWTCVGTAQITVELRPDDEVTAGVIEGLRVQLDAERAKFMQRQAEIMAEISKLQAIEYTEQQS